jgi:triosephosphate isomerase
MARTAIVAGNWKMNTTASGALELVEGIKGGTLDGITTVEKILCPPFVYLQLVCESAKGTTLQVGAQDAFWEEKGAFTGEVSVKMLKDFVTHVIIGHSERRAYFGETDETVNKKLQAALAGGLTPILCVGETAAERQSGATTDVLRRQVQGALAGVSLPATAVIAYEPVWAIGTGVAATVQDADDAIAFIRSELASLQGEAIAEAVRILYGGSVSPANIAEFVAQPDIDGGLVGGASLVAESFVAMVRAVVGAGRRDHTRLGRT